MNMFKRLRLNERLSVNTKAAISYTFASLLSKGLGIITTPLFTRLMSSSEMGVVTTFSSWQSIIGVFATLSLSTGAFNVAMLDYKDNRDQYESSILTLSTLSSGICIIIYLLGKPFWNRIFQLNTTQMAVMLCYFVIVPAFDYWIGRQRYEYKYKKVLLASVSNTILTTAFTITAVVLAKRSGLENLGVVRTVAMTLVPIIFSIYFYISIFKNGKTFANKEYWLFALKINLPLMFHALAKHIFDVSDRVMIGQFRGMSEVGVYGVLYSVSSLSLIVWNAINASLIPFLFEKIKNDEIDDINKTINPILIIYAIIAYMMTLIAPEIVRVLATEEYYAAAYMMPPVAAGIFLTSVYNLFSNVLLYHKKTSYIMVSTMIAAAINIVLNSIFIPRYGFIAASYTTLVSYVFLALFQGFAVRKVHTGKLFNNKLLATIAVSAAALIVSCIPMYPFPILRYFIIVAAFCIAILLRKQLLSLYHKIKK